MKQSTSKKRKAQADAPSAVVNVQQTLSHKKHNSKNIVELEEEASRNKREQDDRDHTKPSASNSNDDVISGNPLIILGHHHNHESNTNNAIMEEDNDEPFGSSVVSKLPPVGFTTNTVSSININEHS